MSWLKNLSLWKIGIAVSIASICMYWYWLRYQLIVIGVLIALLTVLNEFVAYFRSPTLPIVVKAIDLQNGDEKAIKQFRSDCRNLGFGVIEMDDIFWDSARKYKTACSEFLNNNTFDTKLKFEAESKDPLFRELGRKPNIGYILTEHKKEYLKFKDSSNEDCFPNKQIYQLFKELFVKWNNVAMNCMNIILSEPVKKKNENGIEPLTSKIDRDNIRKFGAIHSSLSLIHYFGHKCSKEDEEKLATKDEKLSNRTVEEALGDHIDTGLITMVSCSDVAGLEMLDRKTNKYFKVETIFDPNKHIFCHSGRKMELFSYKNVIKPTWHAVRIPLNTDRFSLLYFMEIQKDH